METFLVQLVRIIMICFEVLVVIYFLSSLFQFFLFPLISFLFEKRNFSTPNILGCYLKATLLRVMNFGGALFAWLIVRNTISPVFNQVLAGEFTQPSDLLLCGSAIVFVPLILVGLFLASHKTAAYIYVAGSCKNTSEDDAKLGKIAKMETSRWVFFTLCALILVFARVLSFSPRTLCGDFFAPRCTAVYRPPNFFSAT